MLCISLAFKVKKLLVKKTYLILYTSINKLGKGRLWLLYIKSKYMYRYYYMFYNTQLIYCVQKYSRVLPIDYIVHEKCEIQQCSDTFFRNECPLIS